MLPDILIGQKLEEMPKIEKFKCDILGDFQTLCHRFRSLSLKNMRFNIRYCTRNKTPPSGDFSLYHISDAQNTVGDGGRFDFARL